MTSDTASATPLLAALDLTVGYGDRAIVCQASFEVYPGQMLVLLGSNGCGKTTILKTCIGLLPRIDGMATLGGSDVAKLKPRERARIAAWVPQIAQTAWSYRARDLVAQGRYPIRGPFGRFGDDD
ncbi:MAG: ABC transporter ATP-binding protein, partial [Spirochaetales bacterium]|nr:ABC transporter ATP-binding protein [Spirochaetales bacterium]